MFIHSAQHTHARHRLISMKGFTLIELLITIAIVAILASIALPAYQNSVLKAGRSDGKVSLLSAAQAMERCFTTTNAYNVALCTDPFPLASGEGKYELTLDPGITPTTFIIIATPDGKQTGDTLCGTLTLSNTGQQTEDGTGTVEECW